MDDTLSEFIAKTSCDPGFARDLLNHHDWNLAQALKSYYRMNDILLDNKDANKSNCDPDLSSKESTYEHVSTLGKEVGFVSNKCSSEPSLSSQSSEVCDSSIISSPSKLTFNSQFNELFGDKKLSRGISRAADNVNLVSKARSEVAQEFQTSSRGSRLLNLDKLLETPDFTFTLPDIYTHQEDFREFLRKDLIEKSTLTSLESSKRLNWWSDICHNLYPLVTSGDGNCLLHAASLGMWGFHDRGLILRRALHVLLSNSLYTQAFYRRWRWQTHFQNAKAGLTFSETEWEREWDNVLRMASTEPRSKNYDSMFDINGGKKDPNEYEEKSYIYESLEEIHIFVLAHVLRRPIIVIADTMLKDSKGEAFFPIPFGGIYLPLECPDECLMKSPLCLTYDAAHFSALVSMNKQNSTDELPLAIPLMDVEHKILPLHFAIDPGEDVFSQSNTKVENLFDNLVKTFTLTEQDKIELIKKYFDILTLAHRKANCVEKEVRVSSSSAKVVQEKSQTLPSNFGRKPDYSEVKLAESVKSKTLVRKSSARQILQKPFASFGRMSKRIKKNIGHLAKRSTSFRLIKSSAALSNSSNDKNTQPSEPSLAGAQLEKTNTAASAAFPPNVKLSIINTDNSVFYCDTYVLAARLFTNKRHLYYDQMIRNYLHTARVRFDNEKQVGASSASSTTSSSTLSSAGSSSSLSSQTTGNNSVESVSKSQIICVNHNCSSTASALTNYLCSSCFEEQKQALIKNNYGHKTSPKKEASKCENNPTKSQTTADSTESKCDSISSQCSPAKYDEHDEIANIKLYNNLNSLKAPLPRDFCITNSL